MRALQQSANRTRLGAAAYLVLVSIGLGHLLFLRAIGCCVVTASCSRPIISIFFNFARRSCRWLSTMGTGKTSSRLVCFVTVGWMIVLVMLGGGCASGAFIANSTDEFPTNTG